MRARRAVARGVFAVVSSVALLAGCGRGRRRPRRRGRCWWNRRAAAATGRWMPSGRSVRARKARCRSASAGNLVAPRRCRRGRAPGPVAGRTGPRRPAAAGTGGAGATGGRRGRTGAHPHRSRPFPPAGGRPAGQPVRPGRAGSGVEAADQQARAPRPADVARNQSGLCATACAPRRRSPAAGRGPGGGGRGPAVFVLAGDGGREVAIALPESRIRDFAVGQPAAVELWNRPGERCRAGSARSRRRRRSAGAHVRRARGAGRRGGRRRRAGAERAGLPAGRWRGVGVGVPLSALQPGEGGTHAVWVVDPATSALRLGAGADRHHGRDPRAGVVRVGCWRLGWWWQVAICCAKARLSHRWIARTGQLTWRHRRSATEAMRRDGIGSPDALTP